MVEHICQRFPALTRPLHLSRNVSFTLGVTLSLKHHSVPKTDSQPWKQNKKRKQVIPSCLDKWLSFCWSPLATLRGEMHQLDLFQRSGIIFHFADQLCEIWFSSVFSVRPIKYFTPTDLTFAGKHWSISCISLSCSRLHGFLIHQCRYLQ